MLSLPSIAIIGPGRVGFSIAAAAKSAGHHVLAIAGRNRQKCRDAAAVLNRGVFRHSAKTEAMDVADAAANARLVLLTVSDSAIESLCQELASKGVFMRGAVVAHCSGALSSAVLDSAINLCDCSTASVHPLQTFADIESGQKNLSGCHWFLEGEAKAVNALSALVVSIKGKPNIIARDHKPLYHAACVMASNYLVALIDVALSIMSETSIGRDTGLRVLAPLIQTAITNTLKDGTEMALTGPISRADVLTLQRHLKALEGGDNDFAEIYRTLGRQTVKLALRRNSINGQQASEILSKL